jgi:D-alanine-D-alanine ligase
MHDLDRRRFDPILVVIERHGDTGWCIDGDDPVRPTAAIDALRERGVEVCFLALHGPFGEDGRVQAFLETCGIPFTGSGSSAAAVSGNKIFSKRILQAERVRCAADRLVPPSNADEIESSLGFPCVVKDPSQGSTLGMEIVKDRNALDEALKDLGRGGTCLLVEQAVVGREFTVSVLDLPGEGPRTLPIVEIVSPNGYFDFEAKYSETNGAQEICPAEIDGPAAERMREVAMLAHRIFGMRHFSRTDFLLPENEESVYLETNSIPGLTAQSLFPKSARAAGIEFTDLLTHLVNAALPIDAANT